MTFLVIAEHNVLMQGQDSAAWRGQRTGGTQTDRGALTRQS